MNNVQQWVKFNNTLRQKACDGEGYGHSVKLVNEMYFAYSDVIRAIAYLNAYISSMNSLGALVTMDIITHIDESLKSVDEKYTVFKTHMNTYRTIEMFKDDLPKIDEWDDEVALSIVNIHNTAIEMRHKLLII